VIVEYSFIIGKGEGVSIDAGRPDGPLDYFRQHDGKVSMRDTISFLKVHHQ
jgi:hypothetical protein